MQDCGLSVHKFCNINVFIKQLNFFIQEEWLNAEED